MLQDSSIQQELEFFNLPVSVTRMAPSASNTGTDNNNNNSNNASSQPSPKRVGKSGGKRRSKGRTRTGCLTCRKKHRKCDEAKKQDDEGNIKCNYCTLNGLDCEWPSFIFLSKETINKRIEEGEQQSRLPSAGAGTTTTTTTIATATATTKLKELPLSFHHPPPVTPTSITMPRPSLPSFPESPVLPKVRSTVSISNLLVMSPQPPVIHPPAALTESGKTTFLCPPHTTAFFTGAGPNVKPTLPPLRKTLMGTALPTLPSPISSSSSSDVGTATTQPTLAPVREDPKKLEQERQPSNAPTINPDTPHNPFSPILNNFSDYGSFLLPASEPLDISDFSSLGQDGDDNFLEIPDTLREILFTNALHTNADLDITPITHPPKEVLKEYFINVEKFIADTQQDDLVLNPEQELFLLSHYVKDVGSGLDMFDEGKCMVNMIPQRMKDFSPLKFAVFALTSRRLEKLTSNYPEKFTIRFYHESLKHLARSYTRTSDDILIVVTCIILCVFEMMSSNPRNWKRHLEGCVLLLKTYGIHGLSTDFIDRATFWVFIRMDICNSVISESPTILPSHCYFEDNTMTDEQIEEVFEKEHMHANYIVYICSRVMNLIYGEKEGGLFKQEWIQLWEILRCWASNSTELFQPAYELFDEKTQFPRIFYANSQAISSNQMYHMACILLLQNKPRSLKLSELAAIDTTATAAAATTTTTTEDKITTPGQGTNTNTNTNTSTAMVLAVSTNKTTGVVSDTPGTIVSVASSSSTAQKEVNQAITPLYHARRIVGISITNEDYGAFCNSIQPLFVAGCFLGNKKEHGITLGALRKVEEKTGWSTHWRCRDLINYWGEV